MGELIDLSARRVVREHRWNDLAPTFFFDVADPFCYLTAERVERSLGEVAWVAVPGDAPGEAAPNAAQVRERAESRARALRLPLVWPDTFPKATPCALRAADYACEIGAGQQFALAASRLAFCGGFDLEDPEVLTEAAAAAGIPLEGCLEAAHERWRDDELADVAGLLRANRISELPAVTIDGRWFAGDAALLGGGALHLEPFRARRPRAESRSYGRPLAPVC